MKITQASLQGDCNDAIEGLIMHSPYNAQDGKDSALARYNILKTIDGIVGPQVAKIEKQIKEDVRGGSQPTGATLTENYKLSIAAGKPRESFDRDAFIEAVSEAFNIPKHKLQQIALSSTKLGAAPLSVGVEYIGDLR